MPAFEGITRRTIGSYQVTVRQAQADTYRADEAVCVALDGLFKIDDPTPKDILAAIKDVPGLTEVEIMDFDGTGISVNPD